MGRYDIACVGNFDNYEALRDAVSRLRKNENILGVVDCPGFQSWESDPMPEDASEGWTFVETTERIRTFDGLTKAKNVSRIIGTSGRYEYLVRVGVPHGEESSANLANAIERDVRSQPGVRSTETLVIVQRPEE